MEKEKNATFFYPNSDKIEKTPTKTQENSEQEKILATAEGILKKHKKAFLELAK